MRTCLAKLDCFLDDFTGAEAHLRHTNTALTSEISLFTTLPPPPVSTPVSKKASDKPARKDLNKVKKSHLFGFESDDSGDESFSIKQPNSAADRLVCHVTKICYHLSCNFSLSSSWDEFSRKGYNLSIASCSNHSSTEEKRSWSCSQLVNFSTSLCRWTLVVCPDQAWGPHMSAKFKFIFKSWMFKM